MRTKNSPQNPLSGVDNLSWDTRTFCPSQEDIKKICSFFSIGKLQNYEKEKNVLISHSSFFVYAATSQGKYALKFYPLDASKRITLEYAFNRLLTHHHFQTPLMRSSKNGRAFLNCSGFLVTCYAYINGQPAWRHIQKPDAFTKINAAMLSLKDILSDSKKNIPCLKNDRLSPTIKALAQKSLSLVREDQKKMINTLLLKALRAYQEHESLFIRQRLHNNASFTNFLIQNKTVYTIDLSHICEDYYLSDLASMVISCLFFETPKTTIKAIINDYLIQHKKTTLPPWKTHKDSEHFIVLNTLVQVGLIKEYLKNAKRKQTVKLSTRPSKIERDYMTQLARRKKLILEYLSTFA